MLCEVLLFKVPVSAVVSVVTLNVVASSAAALGAVAASALAVSAVAAGTAVVIGFHFQHA